MFRIFVFEGFQEIKCVLYIFLGFVDMVPILFHLQKSSLYQVDTQLKNSDKHLIMSKLLATDLVLLISG